ncbi:TPA: hypothetical protein N0F65_001430 [Lagenidium giganteum]|uniref:Secreted protein n=1 Tax=Lagenidium giganteum TaxID=4803 RepID=A0AAV2YY39_9STRA|nr:TPA: hypothetical protein N0F65_001430 [Lagenidium giganteum]
MLLAFSLRGCFALTSEAFPAIGVLHRIYTSATIWTPLQRQIARGRSVHLLTHCRGHFVVASSLRQHFPSTKQCFPPAVASIQLACI